MNESFRIGVALLYSRLYIRMLPWLSTMLFPNFPNIKRYRKIFPVSFSDLKLHFTIKLIYNVIVKFCTSMIVEHIT